MADKKLLEEKAIRQFMKIAGTGALSDKFVKNSLKEEKDLEKADLDKNGSVSPYEKKRGTAIEKSMSLKEESEEDSEEELEEGGLAGKKRIASGTPLKGVGKPGKLQLEVEVPEDDQLDEFGHTAMDYEEEVDLSETADDPAMGAEPDLGEEPPMGGTTEVDVSGLVKAIAAAIQGATGVSIEVEGQEEEEGDLDTEPLDDESPMTDDSGLAPEDEEDPLAEDAVAKLPSDRMQEGKKKVAVIKATKKTPKQEIVEAVTRNVIARLAEAAKKAKTAQTQQINKRIRNK